MAGGLMLTLMLYVQTQLLLYFSVTSVLVMSWNYTYSTEMMTWTEANEWCEGQNQTLMFILNERDEDFLKNKLPKLNSYYWIGLRKKGSNWFWHGTTKMLEGNGSWDSNEPNNKNQDEDCVELYINEQGRHGKWNDEKCDNKKHALCYKASCTEQSCSKHAECEEQISNYTCKCNLGFTGTKCEEALQCPQIATVPYGRMNCSHPVHTNSYNSTCVFSCDEGFELRGSHTTLCDHTGRWTHNPPTCAAACKALRVPDGANVSCYRGKTMVCTVQCPSAYLLLGALEYTCRPDGSWSQFQPLCASYKHMLMVLSGCAAFSTICCCLLSFSYCKKREKPVKQKDPEEVMNPVYDVGDAPLEAPSSSA